MNWIILILLIIGQNSQDTLWTELRDLSRRASSDFQQENWVYTIEWKGGFEGANARLLNYYSQQALAPAVPLSSQAPLARMEEAGLVIPESIPQLRAYLEESNVQGYLNFVLDSREGTVWIVCQAIRVDGSGDMLYSSEIRMTPDLAVLMNLPDNRDRELGDSLVSRIYLDNDVLAIASVELDGTAPMEVAVLSDDELLILARRGNRFVVIDRVSLLQFLPSFYPNRRESGRLYAMPVAGENRQKLLINANVFRFGGIYDPAEEDELVQSGFQPLPFQRIADNEGTSRFLAADYVHGEDNRQLRLDFGSNGTREAEGPEFKDFIPISGQQGNALVMTRENQLYVINLDGATLLELPLQDIPLQRIFRASRQEESLFVWSIISASAYNEAGDGGDSLMLLKVDSEIVPELEIRSQLDIIDATLYNSAGDNTDILIAGTTRQRTTVLEHHSIK